MINLIWAMTNDGIIANKGQLPWKIKEEMHYFKEMTMNKTVVMGSKTFDSMNGPLKGRTNIVLTNHPEKYETKDYEDCVFTNDINELISEYSHNDKKDIWVIGGANIYKQFLPSADYLYVSKITKDYPGDLKFPEVNWNDFEEVSKKEFYPEFTALVYKRK